MAYAEKDVNWVINIIDRAEPSPVRAEYAHVIFSQDSVSYLESLDMMSGEVIMHILLVSIA